MRRLNRIVLINAASFDYVEFPVGGHTQVIGVNGHGKSTLLRTVLFFYLGTNEKSPYALHETKSDFVSYYLGNAPSYLIYEINRTDGEPAFHIAVTRPAGRIQFHFVDAPFRRDGLSTSVHPTKYNTKHQ
ncbi:MAG: ATP-binding protein [Limisphaerales bacterium]